MSNLLEQRTAILDAINEPVKYDLGCGETPEEGFTGIDFHAPDSPGLIRADLFKTPWPIADASVDYFRSSHFLEHVPSWDEHFTEIYRCLKPGGHYEILVPYYWNDRWAQDPDHRQITVGARFNYLRREWRVANRIAHYGAQVNFEVVGWYELLNEDFRDQGFAADYMEFCKRHMINVVDDIAVVLRKIPLDGDVK